MLNVIGNGRIASIKKQIFLSLGLLFSCSQLGAMCPQTVGPISMTEGIWSVLLRVAAAQNVIQSQICAIDCEFTVTCFVYTNSTACVPDCILFGQSDIGAGGTYTISSPGVYCMYNDANWSTGAAITVNSSDVTIDMQNHTLNGGNAGATGIIINGGMSNVTIKNGNITNPTSACIAKGGPDTLLQNIIIQNMSFSQLGGPTSVPAVSMQGGATDDQFYNVLIENCRAYNCYIILNPGLSAVVRGCLFSCNAINSAPNGNANITISGLSSLGESAVIEDCIIGNDNATSYPANTASFLIENMYSGIISNCVSYGSGTAGFTLTAVINGVVSDCVAQQSASYGFYFNSVTNTQVNLSVNNCIAQQCLYGFWVRNTGVGEGYKSAVLNNCVAQQNTDFGFYAANSGAGTVPFRCINCDANGNSTGFAVGFGGGGPTGYGALIGCNSAGNAVGYSFASEVASMNIEHCYAVNNSGNGYTISANHCYFESYAIGNVLDGFRDNTASGSSTNYYFGCRSLNNGTNYSSPVSAFPLLTGYSTGGFNNAYGLNIEG
jgi:hypothetical protein